MKYASYALNVMFLLLIAGYLLVLRNPQDTNQENLNAAWQQFGNEVAKLGELVENAPFNNDEATAADGYRHLSRFLAAFLATQTDYSNPDYPNLSRFPNNVARIGWDNPDNPYLSARIRGDHQYRLRGNLANFELATFSIYSGMLGLHPMQEIRTVSSMTSDDLDIDAQGNFELTLSTKPVTGNWIKLEPDAHIIVIRRLVSKWDNTEEGSWEFINLTTLGRPTPRYTASETTDALQQAVKMTRELRTMLTMAHRAIFQVMGEPNVVPQPKVASGDIAMADPNQATTNVWFELEDDEALLIDTPATDCRYSNIQAANPWMESLDYASHQSSLNSGQAHIDADGHIRYVVSKLDPGVQNWLDTAGLNKGSLFARWTLCSAYPENVKSRVIKLEQLADFLPPGTPRMNKNERAEVIARRQMAISRRYAGG